MPPRDGRPTRAVRRTGRARRAGAGTCGRSCRPRRPPEQHPGNRCRAATPPGRAPTRRTRMAPPRAAAARWPCRRPGGGAGGPGGWRERRSSSPARRTRSGRRPTRGSPGTSARVERDGGRVSGANGRRIRGATAPEFQVGFICWLVWMARPSVLDPASGVPYAPSRNGWRSRASTMRPRNARAGLTTAARMTGLGLDTNPLSRNGKYADGLRGTSRRCPRASSACG